MLYKVPYTQQPLSLAVVVYCFVYPISSIYICLVGSITHSSRYQFLPSVTKSGMQLLVAVKVSPYRSFLFPHLSALYYVSTGFGSYGKPRGSCVEAAQNTHWDYFSLQRG